MMIPVSVLEPFGYTGIPTLNSVHDIADDIANKLSAQYKRLMDKVDKETLTTQPARERFLAVMRYRLMDTATVNGAHDVNIGNVLGWGKNAIHVSFRVRGGRDRISHIMINE